MRCPKCGYISFDHLETCGKCSKDLSAVSATLGGGLYSTEAPRFLMVAAEGEGVFDDAFDQTEDRIINIDDELVDSELDILVAEEDDDSDREIEAFHLSMSGDEEDLAFVDELDEQDVELGEVDEEGGFSLEEPSDDSGFRLSLPDELADISDLAAPVFGEETNVDLDLAEDTPPVEGITQDSDYDLDDLNLELDSFDDLMGASAGGLGAFELSLDDIDFSSTVPREVETAIADDGSLDMDSELDFELDLGGISLHKEK